MIKKPNIKGKGQSKKSIREEEGYKILHHLVEIYYRGERIAKESIIKGKA